MTDLVYDYTSLDFWSIRADLLRFAKSIYTEEEWTDFNVSDEGVRLIELMAYVGDLLSYNSNAQFLETMIPTLIRERNFLTIANAMGYELKRESPARTKLRFTCDAAFFPISLPKHFKVSDKSGAVVFEPDTGATISTVTFDVDATQGETVLSESVGVSDGKARQRFFLERKPLIPDTLTVSVGGVPYTKVKSFAGSTSTSLHYRVIYTEESEAYIEFGDDANGQIPQVGSVVTASYRFGGGSQGNLPANYITRLVDSLPGVVSVTNITKASNGGPRQSLEHAKLQLPAEVRTNNRAVIPSEYAVEAQKVTGVLKAQGVTGRRRGGGNEVILFLVPPDAGELTDSVANDVVNYLLVGTTEESAKGMSGKRVVPRSAVYVNLVQHIEAYAQDGAKKQDIELGLRNMFLDRHSPAKSSFGGTLSLQSAYVFTDPERAAVPGMSRVQIKRFSVIPYSERYVNSPTTGNGYVDSYIDTNEKTARREWNVTVSPPTSSVPEFVVTQRRLGVVTGISSNSISDSSATFEAGELVGYKLHIDEQAQKEVWEISGNSRQGITVSGLSTPSYLSSLFHVGVTGASYAVERTESLVGRIISYTITSVSATALGVTSTVGISSGDRILIHSSSGRKEVVTVDTTSEFLISLSATITSAPVVGDKVSWWWESDDGSVGFSVVPGTIPFAVGDELYVDTFDTAGDIKLRPENFPKLDEANLLVTVVGGVE